MKSYPFQQLDVFTDTPLKGNPLAVVHRADDIDEATMAALANWTNLSETTFLQEPTHPDADYKLRIFTPGRELPFAGHPTLGSCYAWLANGGKAKTDGMVVQECAIGLVAVRQQGTQLAFAAPELVKSGPLDEALLSRVAQVLEIDPGMIVNHQHVDNGPGWVAIMLESAREVLSLNPRYELFGDLALGVIAPSDPQADSDFEVRAFVPAMGIAEDPVTGSLNAGLAKWLIGDGLAKPTYVASQGTALGRKGRVTVEQQGDNIWVGGDVCLCIEGTVRI